MRIAILHYHLKRGGVTRVIESTLNGFDQLAHPPESVVLAGEVARDFRYRHQARAVEGLHYSNAQPETPPPVVLLERLRRTAREALGGEPDLWHIHNHSLGKNGAMPGLVAELAKSGPPLLLQMHDFAEDGRPENHRLNQADAAYAACLYPDSPNVHYGVINARDHSIFSQAGIDTDRLHLLTNPVEAGAAPSVNDSGRILESLGAERLFLYPVRAVRRKNFGEMLLWAALAKKGDLFATTLGPTNQNYEATYKNWQSFARKHNLPVRFGIGEDHDWPFEAIMGSAYAILSTSIAEGFGLAFLEPWLFGKAIVGRDLPDITADFKSHGIRLGGLYDSLPVPSDWIDLPQLRNSITRELTRSYAAYERPLPEDAVDRALAAISPAPGRIDFAGLDESLQQSVIERVVSDPKAAAELPSPHSLPDQDEIRENAARITKAYGLTHYTEALMQIYQSIPESEARTEQYLDPAEILDRFLQPERFRLLRT